MSSLQVSSSISASLFSSQSMTYTEGTTGSNASRSGSLQYASSQQTLVEASVQSSVAIDTDHGNSISISTEAEFSLQFSQRTQLAVGLQSQSPLFGSKQLPNSSIDQLLQQPPEETNVESGSLFDREPLARQIYEDNLKLFDDFIRNHGGEVTKENVRKFVDLMKQTIPEGFSQARGRLDGLGWMNDKDSKTLSETKDTVMDKLESFKQTMFERIENGEVSSVQDITFSELPGVETSGSGFSVALQASVSVELIGVSGQNVSVQAGPGSSSESSKSPLDVTALTDSIVEDTKSLAEKHLTAEDGSVFRQRMNEFFDLVDLSIPEGIRQARQGLSEVGQLNDQDAEKLEEIQTTVLRRLEEYKEQLLSRLKTSERSGTRNDTGEENSERVVTPERSPDNKDRTRDARVSEKDPGREPSAPFYTDPAEGDERIPDPVGAVENPSDAGESRGQGRPDTVPRASERARNRASEQSVLA